MRRGRFGSRERKGARAVTRAGQGKGQLRQGGAAGTHSQDRGSGAQALSGEQKDRDTARPPGKRARGPTATHPRALWQRLAGRPDPATAQLPATRLRRRGVLPAAPTRAAEGPRPRKSSASPWQIRIHLVRLKTHVLGTSSPARRPSPCPHTSSGCGSWRGQALGASNRRGTGKQVLGVRVLGSPRGSLPAHRARAVSLASRPVGPAGPSPNWKWGGVGPGYC